MRVSMARTPAPRSRVNSSTAQPTRRSASTAWLSTALAGTCARHRRPRLSTVAIGGGCMSAAVVEKDVQHHNEVYLVGRLSGAPVERTLPSGDVLVSWRLVVERPHADRGTSKVTNDTLECSSLRAGIRRSVASWSPGDV